MEAGRRAALCGGRVGRRRRRSRRRRRRSPRRPAPSRRARGGGAARRGGGGVAAGRGGAGGVSAGAESQSSGRSVQRLLFGMGCTVTASPSLRGNYGGLRRGDGRGAMVVPSPGDEGGDVHELTSPAAVRPHAGHRGPRRARGAGRRRVRVRGRRVHRHGGQPGVRTRADAAGAGLAGAARAGRAVRPGRSRGLSREGRRRPGAVLSRRTSPPRRTPAPPTRRSSSRATDRAGRPRGAAGPAVGLRRPGSSREGDGLFTRPPAGGAEARGDGRDPRAPGRAAERRASRPRRADAARVRAHVVGAARRLRARRALHGRRRRGGVPRPRPQADDRHAGPRCTSSTWPRSARSGPTSWAPGAGSRSPRRRSRSPRSTRSSGWPAAPAPV